MLSSVLGVLYGGIVDMCGKWTRLYTYAHVTAKTYINLEYQT